MQSPGLLLPSCAIIIYIVVREQRLCLKFYRSSSIKAVNFTRPPLPALQVYFIPTRHPILLTASPRSFPDAWDIDGSSNPPFFLTLSFSTTANKPVSLSSHVWDTDFKRYAFFFYNSIDNYIQEWEEHVNLRSISISPRYQKQKLAIIIDFFLMPWVPETT